MTTLRSTAFTSMLQDRMAAKNIALDDMVQQKEWSDNFRLINWGCWVGAKYGDAMLPDDVPGITEAER